MLRTPLVLLLTTIATRAIAHEDGMLHSHPHLLISNELLAAVLLLAAATLGFLARRILLKSSRRLRADRMPK